MGQSYAQKSAAKVRFFIDMAKFLIEKIFRQIQVPNATKFKAKTIPAIFVFLFVFSDNRDLMIINHF
jgi:hypothetical protein